MINKIFFRKITPILLTLLFICITIDVQAQSGESEVKRMNNWVFGFKVWLTWNVTEEKSVPRVDPNGVGSYDNLNITLPTTSSSASSVQINQQEGVFCLSDKSGKLMLYSDGSTIWNANNQPMKDIYGNPVYVDGSIAMIPGNNSSSQSGVGIPLPGSENRYIIFGIKDNGRMGLGYVIVDMTKNGGLGGIEPTEDTGTINRIHVNYVSLTHHKASGVDSGSGYTMGESLSAVRADDGSVWLTTIARKTEPITNTNYEAYFYSYKLTKNGILDGDGVLWPYNKGNFLPIMTDPANLDEMRGITPTKFIKIADWKPSQNTPSGYMRFSPDYKYFVIGGWLSDGRTAPIVYGKFDNVTGLPEYDEQSGTYNINVMPWADLWKKPSTGSVTNPTIGPYGLEFSKNGKNLFLGTTSRGLLVINFESLLNASNVNEVKSRVLIFTEESLGVNSRPVGAVQMGPDKMIYATKANANIDGNPIQNPSWGLYVIPNPEEDNLDKIAVYDLNKNLIITSGKNGLGLPNFMQGFLDSEIAAIPEYCITFEGESRIELSELENVSLSYILWDFGVEGELPIRYESADIVEDPVTLQKTLTSRYTYYKPGVYKQTVSYYDSSNLKIGDDLVFEVTASQCYVIANPKQRSTNSHSTSTSGRKTTRGHVTKKYTFKK